MIVPYTHLFPTNFVPLQPTEGNAEASRPPTSQRSHRVIYELLPITDWALSRDLQWGDEGESKRRPKDSVVLNNLLQLPDQNTKLPDERNKKKNVLELTQSAAMGITSSTKRPFRRCDQNASYPEICHLEETEPLDTKFM